MAYHANIHQLSLSFIRKSLIKEKYTLSIVLLLRFINHAFSATASCRQGLNSYKRKTWFTGPETISIQYSYFVQSSHWANHLRIWGHELNGNWKPISLQQRLSILYIAVVRLHSDVFWYFTRWLHLSPLTALIVAVNQQQALLKIIYKKSIHDKFNFIIENLRMVALICMRYFKMNWTSL